MSPASLFRFLLGDDVMQKASQKSDLVMPNLFVCGGGGMNLLGGFWWGKFLVCGSRVANDVSAFSGPNRFGKEGILS